MRITIAPDKFKDALSAARVAAALAAGIHVADPAAETTLCPLADGGEGTGRLLADALAAEPRALSVVDPVGRPRNATWWTDRDRTTAIIEMAEASGLWLLAARERDAMRTTSFGTGQLIRAALHQQCHRVVLCVGGSATVDGGSGCLQALGWRFFDEADCEIAEPLCGGLLARIARVEPPRTIPTVEIAILCDVDNPLLGPRGAAPVFAPQKGAAPAQAKQLAAGLQNWAHVLQQCTGSDVRDLAGAGAAGGLPAGLSAALGATLKQGLDVVASYVGLPEKIAASDFVFTGEGRLDEQTGAGKVVAGVARHAAQRNVPVTAFVGATQSHDAAGTNEFAAKLGLRDIVVVTPPNTLLDEALRETGKNLTIAAANYVQRMT